MGKTVLEVFETRDYSIFKRLSGNRDIDHTNKIIKSIKTVGYIMNPIIVNESMEVIDGQHRIEALKYLGMPVHYYVVNGADREVAINLNLGQGNWRPLDYVKSYAEDGRKPYKDLLSLMAEYPNFTLQEILGVAKNKITQTGWGTTQIKDGSFKLTKSEVDMARFKLKKLTEMKDTIKQIQGQRRLIVTIIAWCMGIEGVDIYRLIDKINTNYPKIHPVCVSEVFLQDLSKLYNENIKTKAKIIKFHQIYENMQE